MDLVLQGRHRLQGRQRHLVGPGVAEADTVELDGRAVRRRRGAQVRRVRLLRDRRLQVEDLEHALEADQRGHDVDLDVRHRGERTVQAAEVGGERDDHADGELPADRHHAAEAVDERDGDGRQGGQADPEPRGVQGAGDADVADAVDLVGVVLGLALRVAEDLDQVRARHVEPLVHDLRGVGVQGVALPRDRGDLLAEPAGREDERRQQDQAEQGQLPGHAEHRREHEHDGQRVAHHVLQRRRERLLRAEHVAVEPLHQRARLGAAEERERHALHVVEHRGAQVADQALAHLRRDPAVGDGQPRGDDREHRDDGGHA